MWVSPDGEEKNQARKAEEKIMKIMPAHTSGGQCTHMTARSLPSVNIVTPASHRKALFAFDLLLAVQKYTRLSEVIFLKTAPRSEFPSPESHSGSERRRFERIAHLMYFRNHCNGRGHL